MYNAALQDGKAVPSSDENDSLVVNGEVNMTSPLERQFKKPPPNKHRRRPSKAHLRATADTVSNTQMYHDPVPNSQATCDDDVSPLPSAPPRK